MRLRRLAVPAAAIGLAFAGLTAAPAQADPAPGTPLIGLVVAEQVTVIDGKTKTVRAEVVNAGRTMARGVVLTFGSAQHPVDADVELTLPGSCVQNSCAIGDLAPKARRTVSFTVKMTGDDLTSTFDVAVGGAAGALGFESPVTLVRAKGGVDLEVDPISDLKLSRGQTGDVPVVVRNTGTEDVTGLAVLMISESGLQPLTRYRNCEVDPDPELGGVVCLFEQTFAAGTTFTLPESTPLQVKLAADAGGPYTYTAAVIAVGVTDEDVSITKKSGPTLRLQATEDDEDEGEDETDDINVDDNVAAFGVPVGKSAADSAAIGATFEGSVGESKTVRVGVRNLGPTGVIPWDMDWFPTVRVTVPTGIELTGVDESCVPGADADADADDFDFFDAGTVSGRDYTCFVMDRLGKNGTELFSFTGEITDGKHSAGSVVVDGGVQDGAPANDKAAFGVEVSGSAGGGGGLPVTGTPTGLVALAGGVLLIAGAGAIIVVRRRRIVTVVE
jgi:LPXTG-motif cell wall-anchored protein